MSSARSQHGLHSDGVTPLWAVLLVTFFGSLGTGVFWNAIAFIAKHSYDFSQNRNFLLAVVMGAIYAAGAFTSSRVMRRVQRRISPRTVLMIVMVVQAVLCLGPLTFQSEFVFWLAAAFVSLASAVCWPLVESYLTSGRHGPAMRSAIGWFNLTWMSTVIIPLLAIAPILEHHGRWAIGAQAFANLAALIPLCYFAARPGHHAADLAASNVTDEYPLLLRCARVLLPMSYLLFAAMGPILPYRLEEIGVDVDFETPAVATWMIVRVLALIVMYRMRFWQGRWGTLLLAGTSMAGGFALVVLAPGLSSMMVGFAIFGAGIGMVYYAALYYAMAVGHAEVEASGVHETLIGGGYAVGPLAGLAGTTLAQGTSVGRHMTGGQAIVGIVWAFLAVGAIAAVPPYLAARRLRRRSAKPDR